LPLIKANRPEITFDIVGSKPPPEIVAFNGSGSGVNVTGYVTDPTPYYKSTGVMIVPLRAGGGMRVKILNALAQELPMVTTSLGCEGIAVKSGQHLLIANTPQEFAQAVLRLLDDRQLANTLGKNGRQLIQSTYDYREACRLIDECYRQALAS
jgi:glycosyltransferase involved in cell wall biosynthesis